MTEPVLDIRDLDVRLASPDGDVHAVKGLNLTIAKGETLAIVGESGSGKSQTMMAVMGLLAGNGRVTGSARYRGQELIGLPLKALNAVRGAKITMIFQEPMTSLDPLYTIGAQIMEPIRYHRRVSKAEARGRALDLLRLVQIPDPERRIDAYPHELSGGQRQRLAISRAIILKPKVIVLDEPTSALDRSVQKQIVDLLRDLQARHRLAYVFISHDLAVVRALCDDIIVMRGGKVVEEGPVDAIFDAPQADYTKELMAAALGH